MRKIVNVNVGGFAFVIEEHAYEHLNSYLASVRRNLGTDVDANEVMNDIELRIAELFREELKSAGKEVVEDNLIEKVISIMGKPEDYGTGEPVNEKHEEFSQESAQRRLFRDPDDKKLGGVASGLASYFGWDPIAVRVIFCLLVFGFGFGIPLYIILWILVPEARSTNDKLRMQGKPINVDTIKQGFNDFKSDVKKLTSADGKRRIKNSANSFGNRVESIFSDFGTALGKVIGLIFLLIGIAVFAGITKFLVTGSFSIPESPSEALFFSNHELFFDNNLDYYALVFGGVVLGSMILLGLIKAGVELLFGLKVNSRPLKYIAGAVSVIATVSVIYGAINLGKNYANDETITKRYEIPLKDSVLNVSVLRDEFFNNKVNSVETDFDELISVSNTKIIFGYPDLEIKLSETGKAYFELEKTAAGPRKLRAIENAEAIEYPIQVDSNSITLPSIFSTSVKNKFRAQNVTGVLHVPVNTIITDKNNMKRIFNKYDSYCAFDELNYSPAYKMTKEGLVEVN
jgi:phage shock protein PspC (stress-responsive transcriptional regulator)